MTKIKCGGRWLRDFGQGRTDNPAEAYDFTPDEAHALSEVYADYIPDGPLTSVLAGKDPPRLSPGFDRIWVRYKNTWLSADRQEAFIGTRRAVAPLGEQEIA